VVVIDHHWTSRSNKVFLPHFWLYFILVYIRAIGVYNTAKRENKWRPCGDYCALNAGTIPNFYPVIHIHEFLHNLANCTIFSTIDLVNAYHQIPVNPDDICKTITTPFIQYLHIITQVHDHLFLLTSRTLRAHFSKRECPFSTINTWPVMRNFPGMTRLS